MDRSIGQINNLVQGITTAAVCVMALVTVGSHHVWLGLMAVPKADQDDLLEAPVSKGSLLGSISSVAQLLKRLEEESTQIST